jgi:hypothetical protein
VWVELRVVCFDLEVEGPAAIGSSRGTVVKGGTGPPLRTYARIFLTRAPGSFDDDERGLGRVLEDGNVTCEYSQELRERTGPPLRKCARVFLTGAIGVSDVDLRGNRRVLEDSNVTCEYSRKMRERTGYLAGKSRGNLPSISVPLAKKIVRFVRCCKTQMSPAKVRGKFVKGNWSPKKEVRRSTLTGNLGVAHGLAKKTCRYSTHA